MFVSKDGLIIVNHIPNKNTIKGYKANDFFDCDPLIAPVLAVLNNKGYFTEASCQGHTSVYTEYSKNSLECEFCNNSMFYTTPYILFRYKVPYKNFVDENNNCIIDGWEIEFLIKNDNGEYPVKFVSKLEDGENALAFAIRQKSCYHQNSKDYNDYFKFIKDTLSSIEKLYSFVLLPRRRGIKKPSDSKAKTFAYEFSVYLFDDEEDK